MNRLNCHCYTRPVWILTVCLMVVFGLGTGCGLPAAASDDPPAAAQTSAHPIRDFADHCLKCTVGISCRVGPEASGQSYFGTGAVISENGLIITSTTVVPPGAEAIQVMFAGFESREGKFIEANEALETSVIKVEGAKLPFLPVARDLPQVGQAAYTLSNAHNVLQITGTTTFSAGLISGVYAVENIGGESVYAGLAVETSAAVNPGSDGGPIINQDGQICAIISLNVSEARWQGVGVPTKIILEQLASLKSNDLGLSFEPLAIRPPPSASALAIIQHAREMAPFLASIQVHRKYAPEQLPRSTFDGFRKGIGDWDAKSPVERAALTQFYFEALRLMEVNQMLRRPPQPTSGLVVSADGYILTSSFNVEEDPVFLSGKTDKPPEFVFPQKPEDLKKEPEGGWKRATNTIEKIMVTLPDGSQYEAKLLGQHRPMGIAVLKIEKTDLPFLDMGKSLTAPQLGTSAAIVGSHNGAPTPWTLNSGIVSAPNRNRGFQWQTDALLNYGNSGAPVIDDQGRFLGIATRPIDPLTVLGRIVTTEELPTWTSAPNSGVSMIARADRIAEVFDKLKTGDSTSVIPGPYMGIGPDPNRVFGTDVVVGSVAPGSPAGQAGLQAGDQLLTMNGEELRTWKDMIDHLANFKPGDKIDLLVRRPGITKKIIVNGKPVTNEADLRELMNSLKSGEKFEGQMIQEDTKVLPLILGERR